MPRARQPITERPREHQLRADHAVTFTHVDLSDPVKKNGQCVPRNRRTTSSMLPAQPNTTSSRTRSSHGIPLARSLQPVPPGPTHGILHCSVCLSMRSINSTSRFQLHCWHLPALFLRPTLHRTSVLSHMRRLKPRLGCAALRSESQEACLTVRLGSQLLTNFEVIDSKASGHKKIIN